MEKSVHVIFDESRGMKNSSKEDDSDMDELIFIQRDSSVKAEVQDQSPQDDIKREEPSSLMQPPKTNDSYQGTQIPQGPGPSRPYSSSRRTNWKNHSSHSLENLTSPLDSEMQIRAQARNILAFSAFISQIDPKNIKETLKDADWINVMQEELQFVKSKVWHLVPRLIDRIIIRTKWGV